MALSTLDGLIATYPTKQKVRWSKPGFQPNPGATPLSMFSLGGVPGAGSAPATSAGTVCDATTAGAPPYTAATGSNLSYLQRVFVSGGTEGAYLLFDRLWANGGLVGNSSSVQSFSMPALTRYTNGVGNALWLDVYTALGSTKIVAQASYTNQSGVAGQIAVTNANGAPSVQMNVAGAAIPFTLAAGDTGVQSVQSVTLTTPAASAGNFGLTIRHRLHHAFVGEYDFAQVARFTETGLIAIADLACLEWVYYSDNFGYQQSDNYMAVTIVQG